MGRDATEEEKERKRVKEREKYGLFSLGRSFILPVIIVLMSKTMISSRKKKSKTARERYYKRKKNKRASKQISNHEPPIITTITKHIDLWLVAAMILPGVIDR